MCLRLTRTLLGGTSGGLWGDKRPVVDWTRFPDGLTDLACIVILKRSIPDAIGRMRRGLKNLYLAFCLSGDLYLFTPSFGQSSDPP